MVVRELDLTQDSTGFISIGKEMRGYRRYDTDIALTKLPYGEMLDLMRLMRGRWEVPSLDGLSLEELGCLKGMEIEQTKDVINEWRSFCLSVTSGGMMLQPNLFGVERSEQRDVEAVMAWMNTTGILERVLRLDDEGTKKLVDGAQRAFGSLLGEGDMKPWDTEKARELVMSLFEYGVEQYFSRKPGIID